jgi:hypothetical protein
MHRGHVVHVDATEREARRRQRGVHGLAIFVVPPI